MRKKISKTTLLLALFMALTIIPFSGTAFAQDDAGDGQTVIDENNVYDEDGNIVDYLSGGREPRIAYPNCYSHNWETVYKIVSSSNGYNIKMYNVRCSKCCRYRYTSWYSYPISY